jgi:outer membrane protein TolC
VLAALLSATPSGALTLEDAVRLSLQRNERALAAGETSKAAGARVSRARSFLLPDLTVTGDWTRRSTETTRTVDGETSVLSSRDGLEGRVTLRQTIFDARAFPLLRQAERSRDAADLDAVDVRRGLAYETAEVFLAVLTAERVAEAASERLDLARRNEREVRIRFDTQLVSSNDVSRAELESATAERERVLAEGEARVARLALGQLLDLDVVDSLVVPEPLLRRAAEPPALLEALVAEAAERRPDIRAERARLAALEASAGEPLMRYLPQLDFNASGWTTNESGFSGRDRDWSLGMGLTWPLFDGGDREATRSERLAMARAAALELRSRERAVATDVAAARVQLESRQASLTQAEVAVRAARRNAAEAGELYRRGLIRALEAVDANVQLFEAEVERAGAEFALALAWLDLRAALGLEPLDDMVTQ